MGLRNRFARGSTASESAATPQVGAARSAKAHPAPQSTRTQGVSAWVPMGGNVTIDGRSIPGGAIYVVGTVPTANSGHDDPALIDPSLKVAWNDPDYAGALMDYWPNYSTIDPRSRAAYLSWLADGRRYPGTYIGYVFLFFYGLERRLILDLGNDLAGAEALTLAAEVEALLDIYGEDHSFAGYASELLGFLGVAESVNGALEPPAWDPAYRGWEVPISVRVGLARYAAAGQPIPAAWALSYLRYHPEAYLRTPATRCVSEFDELFATRYRARFGDGLQIRHLTTKLDFVYRPASGGFDRAVSAQIPELPDVTSTAGPINKLKDLASEVTDELDAYSRFIGRRPDEKGTAAAIALLPNELIASHGGTVVDSLRRWVEDRLGEAEHAVAQLDDLVEEWSPGRTQKLAKRDAVAVAALLEKLDIGIEPDVRFGTSTPKPGSSIVLFRLPEGSAAAPSAAYSAAMSLVHLTAVVAAADGSIDSSERAHLARHVEQVLNLDSAERIRLDAHLVFLATGKLSMAGMKRRVEGLPEEERAAVGRFLVGVAAADGIVSPAEISTLTKLFPRLGLDESDVYRQVHALGIDDAGPVTVDTGDPTTRWSVPEPAAEQSQNGGFTLDPVKVQARLVETARVTALLTDIFADDEMSEMLAAPSGAAVDLPPPNAAVSSESVLSDGPSVGGLDVAHSAFARQLAGRSVWVRSEIEDLADSMGLLFLDAALGTINDMSFDVCGEPLAEGDDPIELNSYAVEELNL